MAAPRVGDQERCQHIWGSSGGLAARSGGVRRSLVGAPCSPHRVRRDRPISLPSPQGAQRHFDNPWGEVAPPFSSEARRTVLKAAAVALKVRAAARTAGAALPHPDSQVQADWLRAVPPTHPPHPGGQGRGQGAQRRVGRRRVCGPRRRRADVPAHRAAGGGVSPDCCCCAGLFESVEAHSPPQ